MRRERDALDLDGADVVAAQARRGVGVEEARVGVPLMHGSKFAALSPVCRTGPNLLTEPFLADNPNMLLIKRKRSVFLK